MSNSKVSILLPVYNTEKYLKRCLDALLRQTYREIEIVAVNDGSTDSSLAILEDYASRDSRIKVFSHENKGPATTRNVALDNATGEYLMFCDSDDWYEDNMVERMVATIESEKVDVVMCQANRVLDDECNRDMEVVSEDFINPKKGAKDAIRHNVLLWNKIFRKSVIDQYQIRFPDGREHDDWAFCEIMRFVASRYFYLEERLYNYVFRSGSVYDCDSRGCPHNRRDRLEMCYFVFENLTRLGLVDRRKKDIIRIFNSAINGMVYLFSQVENAELLKEVNNFFAQNKIKVRFVMLDGKIYIVMKIFLIKYFVRFLANLCMAHIYRGAKKEKYRKKYRKYKALLSA